MERSRCIPINSRNSSESCALWLPLSDVRYQLRRQERHRACQCIAHMKKIILIAAIAGAAFSASSRAQSADAIIDRAAAAYSRLNSMRAEFRQTLTNPLTGSTQTTSGVILRKKPNLLSINFESGDHVAADGSTLWFYLPSSVPGQVVRMPYSGANASAVDPADQFLNSPRARFNVSSAGTATIGGRATHAIT